MSGKNGFTILIVGNNTSQRAEIAAALQSAGYSTLDAPDPKSAFERMIAAYETNGTPGCHMIVVDSKVPAEDAVVLLQEVRAAGLRRLPMLVVSPTISQDDLEMIAMQRPSSVLIRPFSPDALLQKLTHLLRQAVSAPA